MNKNLLKLEVQDILELKEMVLKMINENEEILEEGIRLEQLKEDGQRDVFWDERVDLMWDELDRKRRTILNLCEFALAMMDTLQGTSLQKQQMQDKIHSLTEIISNMQIHHNLLQQENSFFQDQITHTESQITSIIQQKLQVQTQIQQIIQEKQQIIQEKQQITLQLFQIQSSCTLSEDKISEQLVLELNTKNSVLSSGEQLSDNMQYLQNESKRICEKQAEISVLKEQNIALELKLQEINQENGLIRMEAELAEIALKDALKYKKFQKNMAQLQKDLSLDIHQQSLDIHQKSQLQNFMQGGESISHILNEEIFDFQNEINYSYSPNSQQLFLSNQKSIEVNHIEQIKNPINFYQSQILSFEETLIVKKCEEKNIRKSVQPKFLNKKIIDEKKSSFSTILDYFSKKVVSDRIKIK